jgi:hypothetical protein
MMMLGILQPHDEYGYLAYILDITSQISDEKACARLSATTSTLATHHRKKSETLQANHPRQRII